MKRYFTLLLVILTTLSAAAQEESVEKERKNIIRWNVTPMAVIGPKSLVLGYERVINKNQTASMNVGYLELRPLVNRQGEEIRLFENQSRGGFDLSLDYRFYFKNRNVNPAPDGLYWGPYFAYYNLNYEGQGDILDDGVVVNSLKFKSDFNMISLGAQLGYQFIIKDRFSIDLMLMGPSYSFYRLDNSFDFDSAVDTNSPIYQELKEIYQRLVPGGELILDDVQFSSSGRVKFRTAGFRYGIQLGYFF
jgi:SAM-dependent methyltransferase